MIAECKPTAAAAQTEKRCCPVCDSPDSRLLFRQSFEQLSEVHLLDGYDLVICSDCGAAFADRIPAQPVFDAYYHALSKYDLEYRGGKGSDYDDRRFREIAATVSQHVSDKQARILEIGCATGRLLALLKEAGYQNLNGVDPSPGCARAAAELYGIGVLTCSLFEIPAPEVPFDVVILVGVMEHIRDLDAAVTQLRRLLSPRGRVYAAVPDAAHFARQKAAPFQEFSPEHINFFSSASLANLIEQRGFLRVGEGSFLLEQSRGTWCSSIYGAFEKTSAPPQPVVRDEESERGLTEYLRQSEAAEAAVRATIAGLASSGRPILVWGTGAHTQRLMAECGLTGVNITAFVDSNPKYSGQRLQGIPILPPAALARTTEPILISSYAAQHDIARQIRQDLELGNDLILLYEI
jgi:SAM-dependent methyltransferase